MGLDKSTGMQCGSVFLQIGYGVRPDRAPCRGAAICKKRPLGGRVDLSTATCGDERFLQKGGPTVQSGMILDMVRRVTTPWAKQRRREEREHSAALNREQALCRGTRKLLIQAVFEFMEAAYRKASSNGKYPAKARQVYYPIRGPVEAKTGQRLDSKYFSQTLISRYLADNPEQTADWDIVFDARGHFAEPHTQLVLPLGTLEVRNYLADIERGSRPEAERARRLFPTVGPENRFGAILFVEKEGFDSLFLSSRLAQRYDLAIMSTKGLSVTASRQLVDVLSGGHWVPLFVLHDFDKAGFSIFRTLTRSTGRYRFAHEIEAVDLGIRLADVREWELESERVYYGDSIPVANLRKNGATQEEVDFLYRGLDEKQRHYGERVELNAFSSERFLQWIEQNLQAHGVKRVVPAPKVLDRAYRREVEIQRADAELKEIALRIRQEVAAAAVPESVEREVRRRMKRSKALSWDLALADVVRDHLAQK